MTATTDLEIFARVARTGNMSAAGREMGLSPAVVSKRMNLLEERVGARLFQRTTRQLALTDTGEGYFRRVVDILHLLDEAEDFVSRTSLQPSGLVKITAPTCLSRRQIAPKLPRFRAEFPEVELDFHLSDRLEDIIGEGFDLAIRIGELKDSTLVARKLANDERIVCAAPRYLEACGAPGTPQELQNHNCLFVENQTYWGLTGPDGQSHIRVTGNLRSNSSEFVREGVIAGLGIALRSVWDIAEDLEQGRLVQILPDYREASRSGIYAVYPCREFMPRRVNAFIEFLDALFADMPTRPPAATKSVMTNAS